MIMDLTLVSTLKFDTATRLVSQGFGAVLDLRTSIGSTAGRPIEEPILKVLNQGFIDYHQLPVDLYESEGLGVRDALETMFAAVKPLVLVVDDVEAWREELTFLGLKTLGLPIEAPLHLDVAA
jgi:hypothetical protein